MVDDFWPAYEPARNTEAIPPEFRVTRMLNEFIDSHKADGTTPTQRDVVSLLSGAIIDIEERLVHMQRRLIELQGKYAG
jgi:hypothetical protein